MTMPDRSPHYDHLPFGLYRMTRDGRIVAANRTMLEMLGYRDLTELAERDVERHPLTSYARSTFLALLDRFGEIRNLDAVWTRRDGTTFHAREHVRAVPNQAGQPELCEAVVEPLRDPLDGDATRFALKRIDAAEDALLVIDDQGRVFSANERLLALWQFAAPPRTIDEAVAHIRGQLAPESVDELLRASGGRASRPPGAGHPAPRSSSATPVTLHDRAKRTIALFTWEQRVAGTVISRVFTFREVGDGATSVLRRGLVPMQDLLARAARTLFSAGEARQFLCRVTSNAFHTTHAAFALAFFTTEDDALVQVECVSHVEEARGVASHQRLRVSERVQSLMRAGEAGIVTCTDLGLDIALPHLVVCLAPLVVDGKTGGALCLGVRDRESLFTDDLGVLAAFATIAAIAMNRWTTFARLEASEAKYRAITELVSTLVYDDQLAPDATLATPVPFTRIAEDGDPVPVIHSLLEFERFLHPDSAGAFVEKWQQLRNGDEDIREYCMVTTRGRELWLRDFSRVVERRADGSLRSIGAAIDITESRRREQALRESEAALRRAEEQFRLVVAAASDAILMTDEAQRIVFANRAAEELFGHAAAQLEGQPVTLLLPSAADGAVSGEMMGRTRAGIAVPLDVSVGRIADERVVRSTWICRDASVRKRSEEAQALRAEMLREVATEWQATFDAVLSPIAIVDTNLIVQRVNRAAREMLAHDGQTPARLSDFAQHEPWRTAAALCESVAASGDSRTVRVGDDDTNRVWDISISAARFPSRAGRALIVIARDMTRVAQLEDANRRAEVMSALGTIAAGVAHEVRGPLFGISTALEVIETEVAAPQLEPYFASFRQEMARLGALLEELLAYGRPSVPEPVATPLASVIATARKLCEPSMRARDVRVDVSIEGAPAVAMDQHRMTQLFRNVIENAVQHSPAGSAVTVTAMPDAERARVTCRVVDAGPGFTDEERERAFEPFFSRRRGGTGLGLPLVQRIAEQHHGSVAVGNDDAGGAVVEVVLPLA